jgi:hypothetical protein
MNKISKEDILKVAKTLRLTLTEDQINVTIALYPEYSTNQPELDTNGVIFLILADLPSLNKIDNKLNKYLVTLPSFPNDKSLNNQTILVSAINEDDAKRIVNHLKPGRIIGIVKKVDY